MIADTEENITKSIALQNNGSLLHLDSLAKQMNLSELEDILKLQNNILNSNHPLSPYYGYEFYNNHLYSKPLSKQALQKYPPVFKCTGRVHIGDKEYPGLNDELERYANRHQLDITIDIESVRKMLGSELDPIQIEARELEGRQLIKKPEKYPDAYPCKIEINDEIFFEYILLQIIEIEDDGTIITSNLEQKTGLKIWLKFNINTKDASLNVDISNASNKELLTYSRIRKETMSGGVLQIYVYSFGKNLCTGNIEPVDCETFFSNIDEDIDFFERIIDIEEFIGKTISIPDQILLDDYQKIRYVSELIRGNEYTSALKNQSIVVVIDEKVRTLLDMFDNDGHDFGIISPLSMSIYNNEVNLLILRKYLNVNIEDIDRIKKKVLYSKDGEEIQFDIKSSDDSRFVDRLITEDELMQVS